MQFLRRIVGGGEAADPVGVDDAIASEPEDVDAAERDRELEVLREEQARLDELTQRQLKYAQYSWTPPPQGGDRRADDEAE
jgi:hypothetical protein